MDSLAGERPTQNGLEAGRDYPRTYREFVNRFPDEEAGVTYLEQLRHRRL